MSVVKIKELILGKEIDIQTELIRKIMPNIPNGESSATSYRVYMTPEVQPLNIDLDSKDDLVEAMGDFACFVTDKDSGIGFYVNPTFVRKVIPQMPNGIGSVVSYKAFANGDEPYNLTVESALALVEAMEATSGGGGGGVPSPEIGDVGKFLSAIGEGTLGWKGIPPVVTLSSTSGTLTDEQYALAQLKDCVVLLDSRQYRMESNGSDSISYKAAPRIANGKVIVDKVTITKASKAYLHEAEEASKGTLNENYPLLDYEGPVMDVINIIVGILEGKYAGFRIDDNCDHDNYYHIPETEAYYHIQDIHTYDDDENQRINYYVRFVSVGVDTDGQLKKLFSADYNFIELYDGTYEGNDGLQGQSIDLGGGTKLYRHEVKTLQYYDKYLRISPDGTSFYSNSSMIVSEGHYYIYSETATAYTGRDDIANDIANGKVHSISSASNGGDYIEGGSRPDSISSVFVTVGVNDPINGFTLSKYNLWRCLGATWKSDTVTEL